MISRWMNGWMSWMMTGRSGDGCELYAVLLLAATMVNWLSVVMDVMLALERMVVGTVVRMGLGC
jgi:hypothetical protein